jgi:hypothetical protein
VAVQPAAFLSTVEAGRNPPPPADRAYLMQPIPVATLAQNSQRAAGYGQLIQGTRPSVFAAPEIRFPLAVTQRVLGNRREADSYFHFMASGFSASPWWACAKSELWLREPTRRPPKPGAECVATAQRPHLDGRLDDAVWSQCLPICLASPHGDDAAWPAAVLVARDAEFLFLAASCRKAPGAEYPASKPDEARPRDPDLSQRDRLEVLLDVDRDYMTYYRLVVDHRGWAQETCLGVKAWNPTWYIAATEDAQVWTIEMAIPWTELVESPPKPQDAWAVGIQRLVPGAGFQAWTQPAAPEVRPEGFGLLLFR